tara:strand:- start:246 stop:959 length:714 start_codon:yes stop_codon:yes gene_type:complete
MNIIKQNIPNIITLTNLLLGLCSIIFIFIGDLYLSGILIFIGLILDFLDGLFARILNVKSELGKQLDSMADLITFGVAPGFLLFQLIYYSQTNSYLLDILSINSLYIALFGMLIPIFGAIRLANFNIDENQKNSFIGLPIPAAGIFIASLPLNKSLLFTNTDSLVIISIILSILLISKIPLFSLKISKDETIKSRLNIIRITLILISIILFTSFYFTSVPFIIILYIILSIINNILK